MAWTLSLQHFWWLSTAKSPALSGRSNLLADIKSQRYESLRFRLPYPYAYSQQFLRWFGFDFAAALKFQIAAIAILRFGYWGLATSCYPITWGKLFHIQWEPFSKRPCAYSLFGGLRCNFSLQATCFNCEQQRSHCKCESKTAYKHKQDGPHLVRFGYGVHMEQLEWFWFSVQAGKGFLCASVQFWGESTVSVPVSVPEISSSDGSGSRFGSCKSGSDGSSFRFPAPVPPCISVPAVSKKPPKQL